MTTAGQGRPRRDWALSGRALDALLQCLDADRERAGERYEALRAKLVRIFGWRGCRTPEELADDTLDRVAGKLADGAELHTELAGYVHGIALNVLHEHWRRPVDEVPFDDVAERARVPEVPTHEPAVETRLVCLDRCLSALAAESRELVRAYHAPARGAQIRARQDLARRMGISATALRLRAHRIRKELQVCVAACEARSGRETEPPAPHDAMSQDRP